MNPTYTDFSNLTQRVRTLEDFQNQTMILVILAALAVGLAIGFIFAKYFHKEPQRTSKWQTNSDS